MFEQLKLVQSNQDRMSYITSLQIWKTSDSYLAKPKVMPNWQKSCIRQMYFQQLKVGQSNDIRIL